VTHHLYACGNVAAISNDVDAMAYMIRTTRNNGDPLPNYLGMEPPCLPGFTDSRSDSHQ